MKQPNTNALIITSQALSITSQLLAIGIEIGIIAGGYFLFQKVKKEMESEPEVVAKIEQNTSFKQKMEKAKKIFKAVIG